MKCNEKISSYFTLTKVQEVDDHLKFIQPNVKGYKKVNLLAQLKMGLLKHKVTNIEAQAHLRKYACTDTYTCKCVNNECMLRHV